MSLIDSGMQPCITGYVVNNRAAGSDFDMVYYANDTIEYCVFPKRQRSPRNFMSYPDREDFTIVWSPLAQRQMRRYTYEQ